MFTLRYSKQAIKTVAKMPQGIAVKIRNELNIIAMDPSGYRGDWKPMQGTPYWRLRVGDWRAICEIIDNELIIYVLKIGSRGDVYK
jgi:mRNA interferase RelE/StbE